MSEKHLVRWGAAAVMLSAVTFIGGGMALILAPDSPIVPMLFYAGLVLAVPAVMTMYMVHRRDVGKLGFAGFLLSMLGAILYSAPNYALTAGTFGVQAWHDLWLFSMSNVLPFGALTFLIGLLLSALAEIRGRGQMWSSAMVAIGAILWLIAFLFSLSLYFLLPPATWILGAGLGLKAWGLISADLIGRQMIQEPA